MNIKYFAQLIENEDDNVNGGFHTSMEYQTVDNTNFRKVLFTGPNLQLVVMSLNPGEDIGLEMHSDIDQFIRVDKGGGEAQIDSATYELKDGDAIIIPAGSRHNIIAGKKGLKLYTVYSSPTHEDGVVHKTKQDAKEEEKHE